MPPTPDYLRGQAAGRREALELAAVAILRQAAAWRAEEGRRNKYVASLLSTTTERWLLRLDELAQGLEVDAGRARNEELALARQVPGEPKR